MAFGWTDAGFVPKRYTDIQASLAARYEALTGTRVTLRRTPVLWMLFGVSAYAMKEVWDVLQVLAADSLDPDAAAGAHLDNLAAIRGFERLSAARSTCAVAITGGTNGQVISAGALLEHDATGDAWRLAATVTLDAAGEGTGELESVELGVYEAADTEEFTFTSPVLPSLTVTATDDAEPGQDLETDAELRERMLLAQYAHGRGTEPGLRARLLALDGVQAAIVQSNRTPATVDGIDPHAFRVTLYPDTVDEDEVATTIWANAPIGIGSSGAESATVTDDMGYEQVVRWSYADELDLYLDIVLTTDDDFPGAAEVRAAVSAWATNYLGVGDDVRPHEIAAAIEAAVPGIVTMTVRLKFGSAPGGGDVTNLAVAVDEIAILPDPDDGAYATRIDVSL